MTKFEDLEMLYSRFVSLTVEINDMVRNEDYDLVLEKVQIKTKLIKQLSQAKKTTELTVEQKQKLGQLEQKMRDDYQNVISSLTKLQNEIGIELTKTKQKYKVNTAYEMPSANNHGEIVDFSE